MHIPRQIYEKYLIYRYFYKEKSPERHDRLFETIMR